MSASINNLTNGLAAKRDAKRLGMLFASLFADITALRAAGSAVLFNSGALAIKAGASALAKTVNTVYFKIGASVYSKAAADMAALSGSVTNAKFNIFCFYVDAAGALTTVMGTEGATLAAVVPPAATTTKAMIGFVVINPTGTGPFVGGTTALDDGTVVPNAAYVNTVGDSAFIATLTTTA